MSKPIKDLMTQEYRHRYGNLDGACIVSVIGLDAIATNKLRGELRAKNLRLQVVKNSLAKRAFGDTALAPINAALKGPCALVTGGESVIDAAKALVGLKKNYPKMELLVGVLDGDSELVGVEQLAIMKSRTETLADLAGLIRSPGGRLAGCLLGGGRIAGCLKALIEKAEKAAPAEAAPSEN
ncbi:MAG: 50S ribosomal protein L10 [Phycisphaerae bacterium]|nr:50S ribosomal protein L10 [Phycisphaerae bacterium]